MNTNSISFGKPVTAPVLVPVKHQSTPKCINIPFMVNGGSYKVTAMSFGTPHGAVFVDDVDNVDVAKIGHALSTHPLFPKGASIVFVQMLNKDNKIVRLWQRGEGEILCTQEAACVAGIAAMMLQKTFERGINVLVHRKTFRVQWEGYGGEVFLSEASEMLRPA